MRRFAPLVALVALLIACGGPPRSQGELAGSQFVLSDIVPTVTATAIPIPTATLAPAQLTAQAFRQRQVATETAQQLAACAQVEADYRAAGQVFDPGRARQDVQMAEIEYRVVAIGRAGEGKGYLSSMRDERLRRTLYTCLGF